MKLGKLTAITLIMTLSSVAHAINKGFYAGAGVGYGFLENFTYAQKSEMTKGQGNLGIFTGYNFNRRFGIEAGYKGFVHKTTFFMNKPLNQKFTYTYSALDLIGKLYLPVGDNTPTSLYVFLGVAKVFGRANTNQTIPNVASGANNALVGTGGVGINYDFTRKVTGNAEYTYMHNKTGNNSEAGIPASNLFSLALAYNFGQA